MTKKSHARLQRDATKKQFEELQRSNKCWDDLEGLYISFASGLVNTNQQLKDVYSIPAVVNLVPKRNEVIVTLRGLASDITQFTDELRIIRSAHEGKTGGFLSEQEMLDSIEIFERYTQYQIRYDAVIMPNVSFLLEQAEQALAILAEQQQVSDTDKKAQELLDPTVISDAVIKNGESNE